MDDKIGASLEECLYSGVEGGIDVLNQLLTSNTENAEKGMLEITNWQCHKPEKK
jgi:hypothetical protein